MTILVGDCRSVMPGHAPFDLIIADPPYGDTSLEWDRRVNGWPEVARNCLRQTGSMWVFGSLRFFMESHETFKAAGWKYAQEIVWEKHNGSGFHADRFKRVHELAVQFYRADTPWGSVFNDVQVTPDAVARTVKRKKGRPAHMGKIDARPYCSLDGGPRIMRSVIFMPSMHGKAIHPTEKPSSLLEILIRTSCLPNGLVGDFFAGSGSAGEACAMAERRYVGCEIDKQMAESAQNRLGACLFAASTIS